MKFYRDKPKKLDKIFEGVRKKYFRKTPLKHASILYCFWESDKPKTTPEGNVILGEARILPPRERDVYGYDFCIAVEASNWHNSSSKEKIRLAWHELYHCIVVTDESGKTPKKDKEDRIKIKVRPHDISINTFIAEIEEFGLDHDIKKMLRAMLKADKQRRKK
jgi:hypothetical protein